MCATNEVQEFAALIANHTMVSHVPTSVIKYLYKQGVFVRPNSVIVAQVLPAFVVDEQGREREISILLKV